MKIRNNQHITFQDVNLVPKFGVVKSRSEIDLSTKVSKNIGIKIPIIAAPMQSVVSNDLAIELYKLGGFAFLPRFNTQEDQLKDYLTVKRSGADCGCAFAIEDSLSRIQTLSEAGCKCFILDVAHAHTNHVFGVLETIPDDIWEEVDIIIGSVCTDNAVWDFKYTFPIAGFRVGIGSGSVCSTRTQTGFGIPQLSALDECVRAAGDIPIIADGGIKTSGDIVKALAVGSRSVMLGRLLAAATESPNGHVSDSKPKVYYGEASLIAKNNRGLKTSHIEGESAPITKTTPLEQIINQLLDGIKSGISYGGGSNISELHENHEFVLVSESTKIENGIHA